MADDSTDFDDWTQYEREGHLFRYPTEATHAEISNNATLITAEGTEIRPGMAIEFERLAGCPYNLQAFHDAKHADYCFADLHFDHNAPADEVFATGLDMDWTTLADLLDSGAAWLVETDT